MLASHSCGLRLSRYVVQSDDLGLAGETSTSKVVYSTRSEALLTFDTRLWALIERSDPSSLPADLRDRLVEAAILVDEDEDELASVVRENQAAIEQSPVLYQVVQPTAWCQLGCTYCGQAHTKKAIDGAAQDAFLERTSARLATGAYTHLKIGWFGAEPLVGIAAIRAMTPRLRAAAEAHGCGYSSRIVTNGYTLTPKLAEELFTRHDAQEAEITLDGPRAAHDARRATKAGAGSFDKIFANLQAVAAETQLGLVIRCNVEAGNADDVPALIEMLAAAGLAGRARFYTSPVYSWGNDAQERSLTPEDYAQREMQWLSLQIRLGFNVGLVPPRRKIVCMSVQREAEVVDAYGATYNCTEVPYVPAYGEPNRYEMTAPAGEQPMRAETDAPIRLRNFNEDILAGAHPVCSACPMLPVCGGQCPKAWAEGEAPCPSAKRNIRQRLNLAFALAQPTSRVGH